MNQCEGQISLTEYLQSKIVSKTVMDLTAYINSQGKSQYEQIGNVVRTSYERYKDSKELIGRLTNDISVYVLSQSTAYMNYLRNESR